MKYRNMKNAKAQGGFTLIELMVVITVALIITVGVLASGALVSSTTKAQQGAQNMMMLANQVKTIFPKPDYTGLTNQVLLNAKKVPDNMTGGAGEIKNVWAGDITVAAANPASRFTMTSGSVPTDECTTLAGLLSSNFKEIKIAGQDVKPFGGDYDSAAAVTQCSSASTVDVEVTQG